MKQEMIILCPGQGAQAAGMGKGWLEASAAAQGVFARADKVLRDTLDEKLSTLCFDGPPERLNQTDVAQPAIYTTSAACYVALSENQSDASLRRPIAAAAGLSLGEYTALFIAGVFSFEEGLQLVARRGRFMQDAAEASKGSMVALIGADEQQAVEICERAAHGAVLVPANFNAPGQIVLSGDAAACERAAGVAVEMGLRATALAVAGAFHSALMEPAAQRMARELEAVEFHRPHCPVVSNVTAMPHEAADPASIKQRLVEQITSPVRWSQSCQWLGSMWKEGYHELAPGKVLSGLMRRINREIKVTTHDRPE